MESTIYRVSGAWVIASIIFWLAAAAIGVVTVIVPTLSVILIIRALLLFASTRVTLDEHGVTLKRGLISVSEQRLPFASIQSISTNINPIGNMFDYGTIALSVGNDRDQIKLSNLSGCRDLKEHLEELTHRPALNA